MGNEKHYFVYKSLILPALSAPASPNNLRRRLDEHKRKLVPGFTAKCNINRLVYFEIFEGVRNAIDCEKKIKSWTRAKRVTLLASRNPKWDDLSREWDQPEPFRFTPRIA